MELTFYNSRTGAVSLRYTVRMSVSFKFAPVINKVSPKDIKKGDKIYDWQNSKFFSLSFSESLIVSKMLDKLITGNNKGFDYSDGNNSIKFVVNEKGHYLTITHYPGSKEVKTGEYSRLVFIKSLADGSFHIKYSLGEGKTSKVDISVSLQLGDLLAIKSILENITTYYAIHCYFNNSDKSNKIASNGNGSNTSNVSDSSIDDEEIYDTDTKYEKTNKYETKKQPVVAGVTDSDETDDDELPDID